MNAIPSTPPAKPWRPTSHASVPAASVPGIKRLMTVIIAAAAAFACMTSTQAAVAADDTVGVMGDSITAGYGLTNPDKDRYAAIAGVEGEGLSASCIVDDDTCYVAPLPTWFKSAVRAMDHPDTVVVLIGINDIALGQSYREITDGYRALVRKGKQMNVRVVFGTLVPTSDAYRAMHPLRTRVNKWIRSQDTYVDYAKAMRQKRSPWVQERYDLPDGVHPNERGHERMAEVLLDWIEADVH